MGKQHGSEIIELTQNCRSMRRIEGQVRGVQRMIEEVRCPEILQQMTAIRSAVHQAACCSQGHTW
jgi:DNA-binding FrmR family transcriptional regulator